MPDESPSAQPAAKKNATGNEQQQQAAQLAGSPGRSGCKTAELPEGRRSIHDVLYGLTHI